MYQNHLTQYFNAQIPFFIHLRTKKIIKERYGQKYSNGRGSTFYFMLLIINRDRGVINRKWCQITMTKRILLVDDEADIIFTMKDILEEEGFKVDTFNDPTIALDSYRSNLYDLVILDIKMPKMDGFQLYTKISEKDHKVKICFLTASEMYYEKFR